MLLAASRRHRVLGIGVPLRKPQLSQRLRTNLVLYRLDHTTRAIKMFAKALQTESTRNFPFLTPP